MLFMFLLRRFGGRPMLVGTLFFGCGIALVVVWALTGARLGGGAVLVRYAILCTLIGAGLIARAAYRSRRPPPATPAGDPQEVEEEDASRR